jgi:hypothetical protein
MPAYNSTYKKLAVQWLNEALSFVSSSMLAESFRLRNRQLLVAAKRCAATLAGKSLALRGKASGLFPQPRRNDSA